MPSRVWRGTALLVAGRLFGSACTFAGLWTLAHWLSPEAFGRYTFYLAIFAVLDTLADFGTSNVAQQRTAADADALGGVLAAARRVRFTMGAIGVALVGGGAFAFREPGASWLLLASLYPVTHVFELSATVLKNRLSWGVPVLVRAAASAMSLAFLLALRFAGEVEPARYLCAVALGSALANGLLHLACRAHLPSGPSPRVASYDLFLAALPLGIAGLCQQAYFYVDNLFVRAWCGPEELGRYNLGVRILSYSIMIAIYASQAALPWLAREHARGEIARANAKLGQPLFALACLFAGGAAPWSEEILALFGEHFRGGGESLRWLFGAGAVIYCGSGILTALVAAGRGRAILAIALAALGVNLAANAWLVPREGIVGAAIATLATETTVTLLGFVALARASTSAFAHTWGWLGGPLAFALAWFVSSAIRGG